MAKQATPSLLVIEREGAEPRYEEFADKIIKMGKLSSVNLRLDDPAVNRIHAVLEIHRDNAAQIIDMGSSKGTFVNDKRVQKAKVKSGDILKLASTQITVYIGEEAIAQAKGGGEEEAAVAAEPPVEEATTVGPAPSAPVAEVPVAAAPTAEPPVEEATMIGPAPSTPAAAPAPAAQAPAPVAPVAAPVEATTAAPGPSAPIAAAPVAQPQGAFTGNVPAFQAPMGQPSGQQPVYTTGSFAAPAVGTAAAPNPFGQPSGQQPVYTTGSFAAPATSNPFGQPSGQQPVYTTGSFAAPATGGPFGQPSGQQPVYTTGSFAAPGGFGQPAQQTQQPTAQAGFGQAAPQAGFGQAQTAQPSAAAQQFAGQSFAPSPAIASPRRDGVHPEDTREALEVRMIWNNTVLDYSHFDEPRPITIGAGKSNTFAITNSALPADIESFPLVEVDGKNMLVNFTNEMTGSVERGGETLSLEQLKQDANVRKTSLGYSFVLPPKVFVRIHVAEITFELRFVSIPKPMATGMLLQLDQHYARSMGVSFAVHLLLALMMLFTDENPENLKDNFLQQNNRFTQLLLRPEKKEEKKKKKSGGSKAKGKKGKMGKKKNAPKADRKAGQKKRNPDGTAPIDLKKLEKDLDSDMMQKGMLNALAGAKTMSSIIGAKGVGGADMNAMGGWNGTKVGSAAGAGGLNTGGKGSGGGGMSGDSAGLGKLGTYGLGGGKGGIRGLKGKFRKRKSRVKISAGNAMISGCLDKKIIRRKIAQNRSSIKYCYEKELAKNESLSGTIKIYFVIGARGKVSRSSVKSTSMNNDNVEQCLVRRVKNIRFPRLPSGCETVHVNYPFVFKAS